jgi:hypothetical protein
MDPLGLALENFDSAGQFRTSENGATIDASGVLNGVKFQDARELGEVLAKDPSVPACVAKRTFSYGAGFSPRENDPQWEQINQRFQASGYKFVELMRQVALSDLLYQVPVSTPTAK